jgi:hypothetical protein
MEMLLCSVNAMWTVSGTVNGRLYNLCQGLIRELSLSNSS